ncbi:pirin family protein [Jatrophihabitans endophyticus]|uniref:pirin family protein n=1 Tax=Jatrophihabitans endophyticus TaxID=1206085 RepID=UPI0019DEA48A|nr:pirin family protein [Jatrophihabitans endophyticus]MBE7190496.1 pirin family protein [Jatrophihabitans endophyticus]
MIRRAADRFVSRQPGIESWHAFSAGAHYDAANLSFGPVIGCDEHVVAPGAGFDWHAHRGVVIVSWVLSGTLRHEDDGGAELDLPAGELLVQSTGSGIRHRETNGSDEPLRFVQTTLLLDLDRRVGRPTPPVLIGDVTVELAAVDGLAPGDTAREPQRFAVAGPGSSLIVAW